MKKSVLLSILSALLAIAGFSQTSNYWSANETGRSNLTKDKAVTRATFPLAFKLFSLNKEPLKETLFAAVNNKSASGTPTVISLPNAAGGVEDFEVYEASNFEPALQARFPEIRAFSGKGITDKAATLKLSFSPQGIQTVVFRTGKENEFIEPYSADHRVYAVFAAQPAQGNLPWSCTTPNEQMATTLNRQMGSSGIAARSGGNLKTLRLALSVTGQYSNYFGATSASQVDLVLAAVNATLTHCNGVFERDLALHMNLVAASTNVFYYDAPNDPYTAFAYWNDQTQSTLSTVIGEANYDIGHMFTPFEEGGNAGCIGCICENGSKGMGWSSTTDGFPKGNDFDCLVMHEMGHQMGANHTFSQLIEGTGANKELGAGTTIMSYAKSAGPKVADEWMDVYHEHSIAQIEANLAAKTCPVTTTIANATPVVATLNNYTIPKSTPFALTGSATDANAGDVLTYSWEQNDDSYLCCDNSGPYPTKEVGPNWISFRPTTSPTRYFPQLSTILAGGQVTGPVPGGINIEALSSISRTLNFRLTVRDNAMYRSTAPVSVGQTAFTDVAVMVNAASGPFVVTALDTPVIWLGGSSQTVTWDVAGTTAAPVSCANVKISLSTDGGQTFPTVLAASTPNDGTQVLTIPNTPTTTARIKVEAVGNIFFDISNTNFIIEPQLSAGSTTITAQSCMPGNGVIDPGETVTVNFCVQNNGESATRNLVGILQNTGGVTFASGQRNYGAVPTGGSSVCRSFTFTANGACGSTITASIDFQDGATNLGTVKYTFTLGEITYDTTELTNNTAINISSTTAGPATPYSSDISVSGITGTVSKVTVKLNGLRHYFREDLDILLVSPTGEKVMLMSDVGGGTFISFANLVFDDAGGESLPSSIPYNAIVTLKPTDVDPTDVLPIPAPARPYVTTLSALNNNNPNGTWRLYVADDGGGDGGLIYGGWTLNIMTTTATCCVTPPPVVTVPTVTQPTCATSTGTIVVNATGSGTLEYSINNGASWQLSNTFGDLAAGNYNIRVRQQTNPANSTIYSGNPVVINAQPATPATPSVTITQPTCTVATGSIRVNSPSGSGITYSLDGINYQTSSLFSNIASGNYNLTVKNSTGCISSTSVTITVAPEALATPTIIVTQPSCSFATGIITVSAPIGTGLTYSFFANIYQSSPTFSGVPPGSYSIRVKNSSGCISLPTPITIDPQPASPAAPTVSVTQPTCTIATGSIIVNTPAGTDFTYSINGTNYQTTNVFNNVASDNYNVTTKSSNGCVSAPLPVTINAQPATPAAPTVSVIQPTCTIATGGITVNTPIGADLIYSIDNTNYQTGNVFSNIVSGSYNVTVKTNGGCVSASALVTITTQPVTPDKPVITASGPTTFNQGGSVTLTAPAGFAIYQWSNGATTQSITVTASGTYTVSVTNSNGCTSISSNAVVVTVTVPLSVSHLDGDNGQLTNNSVRPYLQLNNEGSTPVPYSSLTVRYWLTVEDFAPMTNLVIDYAQLGTNKVMMRYVKLPQPRSGTFGYLEYSFAASAGNLAAMSNSGPIQSRAGKSDWTNFNEADDYSYKSSTSYTKNNKITLYQNGNLLWGAEPAAITPLQSLKAFSQDKSSGTTTNTLSPWLKVNNEGNTPVRYKDITVRYWFTADGTQTLNYYLDYAQLGSSNVTAKFVRLATPLNGADTYLELGFNAADSLYPISTTGNVQQRIAKSDYSNFNQLNDHSYKPGSAVMSENLKATVYVKGVLVYGIEPTATGTIAKSNNSTITISAQPIMAGTVKSNSYEEQVAQQSPAIVYPNPNKGQFSIQLNSSKAIKANVEIVNAQGIVISRKAVQANGKSQTVPFSLSDPVAGMYLIKIVSEEGVQVLKMLIQP